MGQSIVLSEIKTEIPLQNENYSNHQILWQPYMERIESLSLESKVSRFCMEAGCMHVVEVGQHFMTKDTGDFGQFRSVACREYTLPRDDGSSQPRGWIQGNTRIGPVLEVTTSCLYGKHGVEIRIWSLSEDNTQSWVRISHGSNKFVIDSNYNNTGSPEDLHEEQALQLKVKDFACRSKAKAKPQRREPVDYSPSIIPMNERKWIDTEPGNSSLSAYEISKNVIHLLRHSLEQYNEKMTERFKCWRIQESSSESISTNPLLVRMIVGKHAWQQEEDQKEDISITLIIREQSFTSELFKDIQDVILLLFHYRTML